MTDEARVCQICGGALEAPLVWCPRCKTPHHADCWTYNGGCSTYGCGATEPRSSPPSTSDSAEDALIIIDGTTDVGSAADTKPVIVIDDEQSVLIGATDVPFGRAVDVLFRGIGLIALLGQAICWPARAIVRVAGDGCIMRCVLLGLAAVAPAFMLNRLELTLPFALYVVASIVFGPVVDWMAEERAVSRETQAITTRRRAVETDRRRRLQVARRIELTTTVRPPMRPPTPKKHRRHKRSRSKRRRST